MQKQIYEDKIKNMFNTTFENVRNIISNNTAIGEPIKTDDGQILIPVSKITIGLMMGSGEYGKIGMFSNKDKLPSSAGNGTIISLKPCGFLVKEDNSYKILPVYDKTYEKIFDKAIDFLSDLKVDK